jgi:hypothetical protein
MARIHGDEHALWTMNELLLASVLDVLALANWQRAGGKGNKPKPIPRPGMGGEAKATKVLGSTAHSPEEVAAYFAQFAPPIEDAISGS